MSSSLFFWFVSRVGFGRKRQMTGLLSVRLAGEKEGAAFAAPSVSA